MKEKVRNYFNDLEFRYTVYTNKLHIINYTKILSLEENRISIIVNNTRLIFKGENFILSKLLDNEILIIGKVLGVEVDEV